MIQRATSITAQTGDGNLGAIAAYDRVAGLTVHGWVAPAQVGAFRTVFNILNTATAPFDQESLETNGSGTLGVFYESGGIQFLSTGYAPSLGTYYFWAISWTTLAGPTYRMRVRLSTDGGQTITHDVTATVTRTYVADELWLGNNTFNEGLLGDYQHVRTHSAELTDAELLSEARFAVSTSPTLINAWELYNTSLTDSQGATNLVPNGSGSITLADASTNSPAVLPIMSRIPFQQVAFYAAVVTSEAELLNAPGVSLVGSEIRLTQSIFVDEVITLTAGRTVVLQSASITLAGRSPTTTGFISADAAPAIDIVGDDCIVKDLFVQNTSTGSALATRFSDRILIQNCTLAQTTGNAALCVDIDGSPYTRIIDCVILHFVGNSGSSGGIVFQSTNDQCLVQGCRFQGVGVGVRVASSGNDQIAIRNCIFEQQDADDPCIVIAANNDEVAITDNLFTQTTNTTGSAFRYITAAAGLSHAIIANNTFGPPLTPNGNTAALSLNTSDGCLIEGNESQLDFLQVVGNQANLTIVDNEVSGSLIENLVGVTLEDAVISLNRASNDIYISGNATGVLQQSSICGNKAVSNVFARVASDTVSGCTIVGNVTDSTITNGGGFSFDAIGFPNCVARGNIESSTSVTTDFPVAAAATPSWNDTLSVDNAAAQAVDINDQNLNNVGQLTGTGTGDPRVAVFGGTYALPQALAPLSGSLVVADPAGGSGGNADNMAFSGIVSQFPTAGSPNIETLDLLAGSGATGRYQIRSTSGIIRLQLESDQANTRGTLRVLNNNDLTFECTTGEALRIDDDSVTSWGARVDGQVWTYVAATDSMQLQTASGGATEWDVIITSRADLAAAYPPAGSVFTVTSAAFINGTVALNAGEQIVIGAGGSLDGVSPQHSIITGDLAGASFSDALVFVNGTLINDDCAITGLRIENANATGIALASNDFTTTQDEGLTWRDLVCDATTGAICRATDRGVIEGCTFVSNAAAGDGLIVSSSSAELLMVRGCTFLTTLGSTGLRCEASATPGVVGCSFDCASAPAIEYAGPVGLVADCRFEDYSTAITGTSVEGPITGNRFEQGSSNCIVADDVLDAVISGNYNAGTLALLQVNGASPSFQRCTLASNVSLGRLVLVDNITATVTADCTFTGNESSQPILDYANTGASVSNCSFTGNRGSRIVSTAGSTFVSGCTFAGNRATTDYTCFVNGTPTNISGSTFDGNSSATATTDVTIASTSNSYFRGNIAGGVREAEFPVAAAEGGQETFNLANTTTETNINAGTGQAFYVRIVALSTFEVTRMATYIAQQGATLQMGVYDDATNLLASTATVATAADNTLQVESLTAPVTLTAGVSYWLAIWVPPSSSGTAFYSLAGGRINDIQYATQENNLAAGLPANRNAGSGPTSNRVYLAALPAP